MELSHDGKFNIASIPRWPPLYKIAYNGVCLHKNDKFCVKTYVMFNNESIQTTFKTIMAKSNKRNQLMAAKMATFF